VLGGLIRFVRVTSFHQQHAALWNSIDRSLTFSQLCGVALAFQEKKISSNVGFKGIAKKAMIFVLIALENIIDQYVIKSGSVLRTMMIMFYLSNEGISIIENAGSMGVPFPQKLKDAIQQLQEK
jgi:toxin secretion/phage lysis holin